MYVYVCINPKDIDMDKMDIIFHFLFWWPLLLLYCYSAVDVVLYVAHIFYRPASISSAVAINKKNNRSGAIAASQNLKELREFEPQTAERTHTHPNTNIIIRTMRDGTVRSAHNSSGIYVIRTDDLVSFFNCHGDRNCFFFGCGSVVSEICKTVIIGEEEKCRTCMFLVLFSVECVVVCVCGSRPCV